MGADNWATCPRCLDVAKNEYDSRLAAVMASYGRVPVDEFDAARSALKSVDPRLFLTFREEYEIYGATEGKITVVYEGVCTKCGLDCSFEDSKPFYSPMSGRSDA